MTYHSEQFVENSVQPLRKKYLSKLAIIYSRKVKFVGSSVLNLNIRNPDKGLSLGLFFQSTQHGL